MYKMATWIVLGWAMMIDLTGSEYRVLSQQHLPSTGSPQGCVLSPLLCIVYTNDCRRQSKDKYILKFAYDTVVARLLHGSESSHGPVVSDLVQWCDDHFLGLNMSKTKHMVMDVSFLRDRKWKLS